MNAIIEMKALNATVENVTIQLFRHIENLNKVLNEQGNEKKQGDAKLAVDKAYADTKKVLKEYNKLIDKKYYLSADLMTIVKSGKNVPAYELKTECFEDGSYKVSLNLIKVYPNMKRMNDCKVLPEHVIDKIDLLRREVAYLKSGKNPVFLTGDTDEKKDVPSSYVAELIASEGDISKNTTKATLAVVLKDITGGEYKKSVFSKLFEDFTGFMIKRSGEWGERNMVSRSVACDIVLEYAHLYFNDLRDIKWTVC